MMGIYKKNSWVFGDHDNYFADNINKSLLIMSTSVIATITRINATKPRWSPPKPHRRTPQQELQRALKILFLFENVLSIFLKNIIKEITYKHNLACKLHDPNLGGMCKDDYIKIIYDYMSVFNIFSTVTNLILRKIKY